MYKCSCAHVFSFLLGVYLGVPISFWSTVEIPICVCKEALLLVTGASVTFVCDPVTPVSCLKPLDPLMPGEGASYNTLLS